MKFAVASEHRDFFEKNKHIEFEGVFSPEEMVLVNGEIAQILSRRLPGSEEKNAPLDPNKIFEAGRDLWRSSEPLKKVTCHRRLGEIASQLTGMRPVRIGYDQYFPSVDRYSKKIQGKYSAYLSNSSSLKELSSLQDIVCGLIFALADSEMSEEKEVSGVFPLKRGNAVFIHPDCEVRWPTLLEGDQSPYYLVVYAGGKSLYLRNSRDPLSGSLIQLGYASGDRLTDKKNPIIFR